MARHKFFAHVPGTMLEQYLPILQKLPLGLEIHMDQQALASDFRPDLERFGEIIRHDDIPCRFHAPFRDLVPGGFDSEAQDLAHRRLGSAVEVAELFGVNTLVAHTEWCPRRNGLEADAWLDRSESFWLGLAGICADRGCKFALENVFDLTPEILSRLLDRLPTEFFGFNFDVGHWHCWADSQLADWFDVLGHRLLSLHLHDNMGGADEHLAVGAGTFPWGQFYPLVRALERPLEWTVECRSVPDVLSSAAHVVENSGIDDFRGLAALNAVDDS
jgi:sugar phosphate isomerase/epimerase